jgi:UDP-N-acetylglucosamine 2-epimerase
VFETVREFTDQNKEKIDKFVKEEYGDGNATKRIVMELEKWIKNI